MSILGVGWAHRPVLQLVTESFDEDDAWQAFHEWLLQGLAQTDNEDDLFIAFEAGADAVREGFIHGGPTGRRYEVTPNNAEEMFELWVWETNLCNGEGCKQAFVAGSHWQLEQDENY